MTAPTDFDAHADGYEAALARGLAVSGETRDFFARGRIRFLKRCLEQVGLRPRSVMDFGCGTGDTAPVIHEVLGPDSVVGLDPSSRSIERAAGTHGGAATGFHVLSSFEPAAALDVVYTNGVFHHIPPPDRAAALGFIHRALRPGGVLAFWENNPWSPAARYVMSRIPFDRGAVMCSAGTARRLARECGFEVLRTDYLFIFPRALDRLRPLEAWLRALPLGAQYQVLCRKR